MATSRYKLTRPVPMATMRPQDAERADGVPVTARKVETQTVKQQRQQDLATTTPAEVQDVDLIDFGENDSENPLNWPYWRKLSIQMLVAVMGLLANFGTVIIVPAVPQILADFNVAGDLYLTLLVSIWELGEAVGPFLVGPLSEKYGRLPVYMGGNFLFIIFSVASAASSNISMLVAFRFLNGFASTSLVVGPSIVGDCFPREERGKSMAVAVAIPMIGPFCAPIIGGFVAERFGWRWTIWLVTILSGAASLVSIFVFRESYKVRILERRACRLLKETGNELFRSRYHVTHTPSSIVELFTRPMRLLVSSPIVFIISLYMSLVYDLSFVILTTLTPVMQSVYGFSEGQAGLAFLGRAVGNIMAIFFHGFTSDRYINHKGKSRGQSKPEDRLFNMFLGACLLVPGIFLYGWTARVHSVWITPIIGTAVIGFSMLLIILPVEGYLVDVFDIHSASAIASGVVLRALFGALFPLVGTPLYNRLGLGWGNSLLGFVFAACLPGLWFLTFFGQKLRRSDGVDTA